MTVENGLFWNKSWNPIHVKGGGYFCTRVSPGCARCWCYSYNQRFGNGLPFDNRPVEFELDQLILEAPLHWRKPQVIAIQWLGDIFHEQIPDLFIKNIIFASEAWDWHKYLFLTKRIERAKEILDKLYSQDVRPYDNLWLGVSISTQKEADEKIPILLATPAAHRFVNLEPCLEGVNIKRYLRPGQQFYDALRNVCSGILNENLPRVSYDKPDGLDWVALGCESGPGRRPMEFEWAQSIAEQCKAAGVKMWIKQVNIDGKVIKDINLFPKELQIREFPWK